MKNKALCEICEIADCDEGYDGKWCPDFSNPDKHPYDFSKQKVTTE